MLVFFFFIPFFLFPVKREKAKMNLIENFVVYFRYEFLKCCMSKTKQNKLVKQINSPLNEKYHNKYKKTICCFFKYLILLKKESVTKHLFFYIFYIFFVCFYVGILQNQHCIVVYHYFKSFVNNGLYSLL